jgi:hypothetical protein
MRDDCLNSYGAGHFSAGMSAHAIGDNEEALRLVDP